jgi:hypothetical protein
MPFNHEQKEFKEIFVHDLRADTIYEIITTSAWQTLNQSINAKESNTNNQTAPDITTHDNTSGVNAFADITLPENEMILDVGGGKFDHAKNYVRTKWQSELLIWDPFNRSHDHNHQVQSQVEKNKVAAATSMSVLNVIPEVESRLAHISTLKYALQLNGIAYFKIWPGEGNHKNSYIPTINDDDRIGFQSNAGADRYLREIQIVFGLQNAYIDERIPNLIIAKKISDSPTTLDEILLIQTKSKQDAWFVANHLKK